MCLVVIPAAAASVGGGHWSHVAQNGHIAVASSSPFAHCGGSVHSTPLSLALSHSRTWIPVQPQPKLTLYKQHMLAATKR